MGSRILDSVLLTGYRTFGVIPEAMRYTLEGGLTIQNPWHSGGSVDQLHNLGDMIDIGDWTFRYGKAGVANLVPGSMCQAPAELGTTEHNNIALSAAVLAGSKVLIPTLGALAVVEDAYADGLVYFNDAGAATTLQGVAFEIKSHPASLASTTLEVTLKQGVPLALTTAVEVSLMQSPQKGSIVVPSGGQTTVQVGIPVGLITAAYYGWFAVAGIWPCYAVGTVVVSNPVGIGGTTDGACGPQATDTILAQWGTCARVQVTTEHVPILLNVPH